MSKCMPRIVPEGLFHKPIFFAAVLLCRGLSKGPSFQTQQEKLLRSLEGMHLEGMTSPSASAEMWIKKCCSTARYESPCLSNTYWWSPWWLGQAPKKNDLGKYIFLSPYFFLVTSKCLPLTLLLLQPASDLHFKDKAALREPGRPYFIPNCNHEGGNSTTHIWKRCHSPWEITLLVKRETDGVGQPLVASRPGSTTLFSSNTPSPLE